MLSMRTVLRDGWQSVLRFMGQRNADLDGGSLTRTGGNHNLATHEVDAFFHAGQSQARSALPCGRIEAAAEVPDLQIQEFQIGIQGHVNAVRLGVLDRIAQGLLGDPVHAQGQVSRHTGRQLCRSGSSRPNVRAPPRDRTRREGRP